MKSIDVIKIRIGGIVLFSFILSLLFGLFYYLLYNYKIDSFNFKNEDGRTNWDIIINKRSFEFWYYSWLNQLTVGYAQFFPISDVGKLLSVIQIFLFWIVVLSFSIIIDEDNIIKLVKKFRH